MIAIWVSFYYLQIPRRKSVEGFAAAQGVGDESTRQIVKKVVADMLDRTDDDRVTEARKRLLIATE